jgi:hypothetical protein
MKTTDFNFNRIGLLLQRYFTERYRPELMYWIITVIVFMFFRNSVPTMVAFICVMGAFYASRFFKEIHSPANGIAYYMIPATQLEKLTVGIFVTSFYYFIMMIIAYVTGNLLGTLLNNTLASMNFLSGFFNIFHYSPLQWNLFATSTFTANTITIPDVSAGTNNLVSLFTGFLFSQSIFLLGGIYFKSNQILKTILTFIVFSIFQSLFFSLEIKMIFGDMNVFMALAQKEKLEAIALTIRDVVRVFFYLLIPFFWVVSYFRLTEKQV